MKRKSFRLLTVFLTVVMLFALSLQVYAASGEAVTKDGLTVQLFTDKNSYQADEPVKAAVRVDNYSGKDVFIFSSISVPEGVKLANDSAAHDATLKAGESWSTPGVQISNDIKTSANATSDNMHAGGWAVLSVLAVCSVIALLVYGRKKKTWLSVLLCIAMLGGAMGAAVPVQAADISGSISVSCNIQVDGKAATVSALVNYVIYDEADDQNAADSTTDSTTSSEPSTPIEPTEPSEPDTPDTPTEPSEPGDSGETPTPSGSQELLENGGFENLTASGAPAGWSFSGGAIGDMFKIDTTEKAGGENSLYCNSDDLSTKAYGITSFSGLVKDTEYTVTFKAKVKGAEKIALKLEFSDLDEYGMVVRVPGEYDVQENVLEFATENWEEYSFKFTAPGAFATLYARFYGGEVWYDDISIIGEKGVIEDSGDGNNTAMNLKDPLPGAQNMVVNGSFEDLDASGKPVNWVELNNLAATEEPTGWFCSKELWDGSSAVSLEEISSDEGGAYDGTHAVRITSTAGLTHPYVGFYLRDIEPGAEYQVRAWLNQVNTATVGGMIKVEFFADEDKAKIPNPDKPEKFCVFPPFLIE